MDNFNAIVLTHFSSLSASCASRVAIAASAAAALRARFITVLGATVDSIFAVFSFEGGFDIALHVDFNFSCVAASGGGLAYTVSDRVFLVVERVTTGIALLM